MCLLATQFEMNEGEGKTCNVIFICAARSITSALLDISYTFWNRQIINKVQYINTITKSLSHMN